MTKALKKKPAAKKTVFMTPETLQTIAKGFWGEGWRKAFQDYFDMSYSQLHRYMLMYKGQTIPKHIALALDMMMTLKANEIPFPDLAEYIKPIAEAKPVKFEFEKKVRVPRVQANAAPEIDIFAIESIPVPEPIETKPEPIQVPEPKREMVKKEPTKKRPAAGKVETTAKKPARRAAKA